MSEESESDELNESELIELPFFLRALFDWLLDHHAVSCDFFLDWVPANSDLYFIFT